MLLNIPVIPFGNLVDIEAVSCAYSSRVFGNMSFSYQETRASLSNRKIFLTLLSIDYQDLVCAKQIHAANIRYATEEDRGRGALSYDTSIPDTDALVTDKKNLPLAVFSADCLSIFVYDPITPAIGLIHAGLRGSKENISAKTVKFLQEKFNTQALNLYVGFGPAIRSCCYEVGKGSENSFPGELIRRDNHDYLDLAKTNKKQLLDSGVKENNIFDSGVCTSCRNEEFFSYRKEGKICGRTLCVIMLK